MSNPTALTWLLRGTYTETMTRYYRDAGLRDIEITYTQPRLRRAIARVYHAWDMATGRFVRHHIDPPLQRLHDRHCNDDCGTWTEMLTGATGPGCTWTQPSLRQDIRCFHLSRKGYTRLYERPAHAE